MQLEAHDRPAAARLRRSAERDSIPHCSPLLNTCFFPQLSLQLIRRGQNQTPSPSLPYDCQILQSVAVHFTLPTSHCGGAKTSKPFEALFHAHCCFKQSFCAFCKNPTHVHDKQRQKGQLRKSDLSLRLQSTLMPLFAGHICIWVTKGSVREG